MAGVEFYDGPRSRGGAAAGRQARSQSRYSLSGRLQQKRQNDLHRPSHAKVILVQEAPHQDRSFLNFARGGRKDAHDPARYRLAGPWARVIRRLPEAYDSKLNQVMPSKPHAPRRKKYFTLRRRRSRKLISSSDRKGSWMNALSCPSRRPAWRPARCAVPKFRRAGFMCIPIG
jgi:hypothetical protein